MRALLLVLLLAGCATAEERAYRQQQQRENYISSLAQRCEAYGIPKTDQRFPNCMMQLDMMVQQQKAARDAQDLAMIGAYLNQPSRTFVPNYQPTFRCYPDRIGGFICQ